MAGSGAAPGDGDRAAVAPIRQPPAPAPPVGGGGRDDTGRQASFREWTWDPDPADDWIQVEYEFTLHAADGTSQVVHEAHRLAAVSKDTWLRMLAEAGFEALATDAPAGARGYVFTGRRPVQSHEL